MDGSRIALEPVSGMTERLVAPGEVIYREGEDSDAVFVIEEGEVTVTRLDPRGKRVTLAGLGRGQFFGEMGVIRDTTRSTTVSAKGKVKLLVLGKADFLAAFGADNPIALPLLRMLCERLSSADGQLLSGRLLRPGAPMAEVARITLLPASRSTENQIGDEGVVVSDLPFRVGRKLRAREHGRYAAVSLALGAKDIFDISPEHFALEEQNERLIVRDLGSDLGTIVNGIRIADFEQTSVVGLQFGQNLIQPGGIDCPFQFSVVVEKR